MSKFLILEIWIYWDKIVPSVEKKWLTGVHKSERMIILTEVGVGVAH